MLGQFINSSIVERQNYPVANRRQVSRPTRLPLASPRPIGKNPLYASQTDVFRKSRLSFSGNSHSSQASQNLPNAPLTDSHQALIEAFNIPYQIMVLTKQQAWPGLAPVRAAKALQNAPFVAVGDAHASALKILETLVLANMVTMPVDKAKAFIEQYHQLTDPNLSISEFRKKDKALREIIQSIEWTGNGRQLLLIGDTLSDRGPSDPLVMKLVSHLRFQLPGCILEVASNHNENVLNEFVCRILQGNWKVGRCIKKTDKNSLNKTIEAYLNSTNLESWKLILNRYAEHSENYDLLKRKGDTLFTHAPIDNDDLDNLHRILPHNERLERPSQITEPAKAYQFMQAANDFYRRYHQEAFELFSLAFQKRNEAQNQQFTEQRDQFLKKWQQIQAVFHKTDDDGFLWSKNNFYFLRDEVKERFPFYKVGIRNLVHGHTNETVTESPFSLYERERKKKISKNTGNSETEPECTIIGLDQEVRKDLSRDRWIAQKPDRVYPSYEQSKIFAIF